MILLLLAYKKLKFKWKITFPFKNPKISKMGIFEIEMGIPYFCFKININKILMLLIYKKDNLNMKNVLPRLKIEKC